MDRMLSCEDKDLALMRMNKWGGLSVRHRPPAAFPFHALAMANNLDNRPRDLRLLANHFSKGSAFQAWCAVGWQIAHDNFILRENNDVELVEMTEYYTGSEYDDLSDFSGCFSEELEITSEDLVQAIKEVEQESQQLAIPSAGAEAVADDPGSFDAKAVENRARRKARKRRRLKKKAKVLAQSKAQSVAGGPEPEAPQRETPTFRGSRHSHDSQVHAIHPEPEAPPRETPTFRGCRHSQESQEAEPEAFLEVPARLRSAEPVQASKGAFRGGSICLLFLRAPSQASLERC